MPEQEVYAMSKLLEGLQLEGFRNLTTYRAKHSPNI